VLTSDRSEKEKETHEQTKEGESKVEGTASIVEE
jgi:hypothetical protein